MVVTIRKMIVRRTIVLVVVVKPSTNCWIGPKEVARVTRAKMTRGRVMGLIVMRTERVRIFLTVQSKSKRIVVTARRALLLRSKMLEEKGLKIMGKRKKVVIETQEIMLSAVFESFTACGDIVDNMLKG